MSDITKLPPKQYISDKDIEALGEMLVDMKEGRIKEFFILVDRGEEGIYERKCSFRDRVKALGALEYLKATMLMR